MSSAGELAAEHRQTCRITLIVVEYSCPEILGPSFEAYPGPAHSPRKGSMVRLEWNAKNLALNAKAPMTGKDARALGAEIGDAVTMEIFRSPFATMILNSLG